jgi:hypothetical protein
VPIKVATKHSHKVGAWLNLIGGSQRHLQTCTTPRKPRDGLTTIISRKKIYGYTFHNRIKRKFNFFYWTRRKVPKKGAFTKGTACEHCYDPHKHAEPIPSKRFSFSFWFLIARDFLKSKLTMRTVSLTLTAV